MMYESQILPSRLTSHSLMCNKFQTEIQFHQQQKKTQHISIEESSTRFGSRIKDYKTVKW